MLRIGLTGGMGSGKSRVASALSDLGAHVIEADAVARRLVSPGSSMLDAIVGAFGESVLAADGSLDRRALAASAFASEERTDTLNRITHPALVAEIVRMAEELERNHPEGVLVVDAALLVQWDMLDMFDVVLLVRASSELRVQRLVSAGFSEDDVRRRIKSQLPDDDMIASADTVIENEGTLAELRAAVDGFWESLPDNIQEDRS